MPKSPVDQNLQSITTNGHPSSDHHRNGHHKNGFYTDSTQTEIHTPASPNTDEWLHDPAEALQRELGPYTVLDMEKYVDDYQIELYNGWLVWRDMGHIQERSVVSTIQAMLDISARKQDFGQALNDGTECRLDEGNDIIPDAALVSWKRLGNDVIKHGPNKRPLLAKCPELVIESRSESNTRKGDALKRKMYFANGTQIIWDVDEEHKFIDVYRVESPEKPKRFDGDDLIDCEPLMPGWRRSIRDIFAEHASAEAVAGEAADEWREEGVEIGMEKGVEIGMEKGVEIGMEKGVEIGMEKGVETVARNMLSAAMDPETVAQMTGMPLAKIQELQKELT